MKLSHKAKTAARHLAVSYAAYQTARNTFFHGSRDSAAANDVCVWGRMLIDAQRELGIELATPSLVMRMIERAQACLDAAKKEVA